MMDLRRRFRPGEGAIEALLFVCALVSILTTAGIVFTLAEESFAFFAKVNPFAFLFGTRWQPQLESFGVLPLLNATLMTSAIAMAVALPAGLGVAVYLSEYAPDRLRSVIKSTLEVLAGIPTVVYGFFALNTVTPGLQGIFGGEAVDVYNTLSAGLVMGVLILPLVSSLCEDALSAVPDSLREGAYALGATKLEVAVRIVLPAAFSGIAAATILALSRAVGETMIVAMASGAGPNLTANPLRSAETMTGHIVRISGGDIGWDTVDYNSLFAIAALLFVITMILNLISRRIVARYGEVYE